MIIECACKKYKFAVKAEEIGINGRVVQCGVCDQKWFQEPASTEEFKLLKENLVKEKENIETKAENKKNLKDKDKKNYIPIKYKDKSDTSYFKILIIIFFIIFVGLIFMYENRAFLSGQYPELSEFFILFEEFVEYLNQYYKDFLEIFFPKKLLEK
jgi:predicted Zn finger-like uncharacterized protein